jgi:predicted MPP superfamily phosphohydrolase
MLLIVFFLVIFIILIDLAVYSGISRTFRLKEKPNSAKRVKIVYWGVTILFALFAVSYIIIEKNSNKPDYIIYRAYFMLTGIFILIYIPKLLFAVFFLIEALFRLIAMLINRSFKTFALRWIEKTRILSITGIVVAFGMFIAVLEGMTIGRTDFKTEHVVIHFKNLPKAFDGLKIAQISDMHLGSFYDSLDVKKGIVQLMNEKPDVIMFTGDLVNNESVEARIMLSELKRLHAPLGVFSILGNHDVGDYRRWKTIGEKNEDLDELKKVEEEAGFTLLIDENYILRKGSDSIALLGINTWGKAPFKKYGKLKKAMKGVENFPFKILLSHIPTQWEEEVSGKTNIDLTLAGHTHAMQFGINCFGIFWSPIKWVYPHWAGLYNNGDQYLYVNRGFGYIGFPGRIGMTPEITIIELKKQ